MKYKPMNEQMSYKFCTILIIKSWDAKFVMHDSMTPWRRRCICEHMHPGLKLVFPQFERPQAWYQWLAP
jgi:hypothetical protein